MGLFLALLSCALLAEWRSVLPIVVVNSRNSRLGLQKFRFRSATGIRPQPTDYAYSFPRPNGDSVAKWRKFPVRRE
jgi:hypothetical protein